MERLCGSLQGHVPGTTSHPRIPLTAQGRAEDAPEQEGRQQARRDAHADADAELGHGCTLHHQKQRMGAAVDDMHGQSIIHLVHSLDCDAPYFVGPYP